MHITKLKIKIEESRIGVWNKGNTYLNNVCYWVTASKLKCNPEKN